MKTIDLVIPYVNNKDKVWEKQFVEYCLKHNHKHVADLHGSRYEDVGLIDYQLKLVERNMPWVRTIWLILSNKEQAPKYLPSNCKIVYHHEFIPYRFLPTFNSTTIEMFIWDIKGLSEKFIYANDDMLPIGLLKPSDFFYRNHIKMNFKTAILSRDSGVFRYQCYNSYYNLIKNLPYYPYDDKNMYFYPEHTMTPMIKTNCKLAFKCMEKDILPHIGAFRTEYQHNQYIYPNYEKITDNAIDSDIDFYYSHLNEEPSVLQEKLDTVKIFCANILKKKENVAILLRKLNELCK